MRSMTGDGGRGTRVRRGWSDLADDILDVIYRMCCSSSYDRARFAAVCSSWRAVALWHPKVPALPLLLPSTWDANTPAYSLEDGRFLRGVPLQGCPSGRLVGFHDGGWVAAATGARLLIVNVFSGARVPLSLKQSIIGCKFHPRVANRVADQPQDPVTKIIFSDVPSSSDCVIAAITASRLCNLALCRVGCPDGWSTTGEWNIDTHGQLTDIAFYNGKLYGLAYLSLYKFDVSMNGSGPPTVTSVHCFDIEGGILGECLQQWHEKYVFQLHGKLAIAMKFWPSYPCETHFLRVFELVDSGCTWVEVTSLGEHALFLGPACSKAVHVPVIGGRNTAERNQIYYCEQQLYHETKFKRLDLNSYTVYYRKSEGVASSERIMSWGYHYCNKDGSNGCIWILPPDL